MGRVNWQEARLLYVKDTRVSYSSLAHMYGVTKPTIQAHATKHDWVEQRKDFAEYKTACLMKAAKETKKDFEVKQIKIFKSMQSHALRALHILHDDIQKGQIKSKQANAINAVVRMLSYAIEQERLVKGIQYRPIVHYLADGGTLKHPLPDTDQENFPELTLDEEIVEAEKFLAHLKRRKSLIERSNAL